MADALDGVSQLVVGRNKAVEILLCDLQQVGVLNGANRGSARAPAEQGHFSKRVPLAEHGNCAAVSLSTWQAVWQNLHFSIRDDIEGITRIPCLEQNSAGLQVAITDTR